MPVLDVVKPSPFAYTIRCLTDQKQASRVPLAYCFTPTVRRYACQTRTFVVLYLKRKITRGETGLFSIVDSRASVGASLLLEMRHPKWHNLPFFLFLFFLFLTKSFRSLGSWTSATLGDAKLCGELRLTCHLCIIMQ